MGKNRKKINYKIFFKNALFTRAYPHRILDVFKTILIKLDKFFKVTKTYIRKKFNLGRLTNFKWRPFNCFNKTARKWPNTKIII